MKWSVSLFLVVVGTLCYARLGETEAEAFARYSRVIQTNDCALSECKSITYLKGKYVVTCVFYKGKVHYITYTKPHLYEVNGQVKIGENEDFTLEELAYLRAVNGLNRNWEEINIVAEVSKAGSEFEADQLRKSSYIAYGWKTDDELIYAVYRKDTKVFTVNTKVMENHVNEEAIKGFMDL